MKTAYIIKDNVITSLGLSSTENMAAINIGHSGISSPVNDFGIPESFTASSVDNSKLNEYFSRFASTRMYTDFERLVISSVHNASENSGIDLSSPETLFVISTTKGNVSLLDPLNAVGFDKDRVNLWAAAKEIVSFFRNPNIPVIVSQACISGVSAILVAKKYLEAGLYKHVVITGGDVLSKFVVSGFQSFKALSPTCCKPFDKSRDGLSLGEGAATIILGIADVSDLPKNTIGIKTGAITNDANHISGPSRNGEGLYRAIKNSIGIDDYQDLAFINAHGTATLFNDEMESIAISRAGLEHVPVNSLKGYFGHTLGAAGLIETVVCSHSLINSQLVKCLGFESHGVTGNIDVIKENRKFEATECLKMASGFGGCNGILILKKYN